MYSIHTFLLQKELFRSPEPVKTSVVSSFTDTPALQQIARQADSDYILFYTGTSPIELHPYAIGRMYQIAESNDGALFYSDYQEIRQGKKIHHPTLEYQTGSIRNDFDFGQLLLFRNDSFQQVVAQMNTDYRFAALYELRLSISRLGKIVHIPETLYTVQPTDLRLSGEKQFDYVDPANREVQLEMEAVCTAHLQAIGAWLAPEFQRIDFGQENFAREASVIIPVRNRKRTIAEAVESALQQQTDFSFNVIVVDNHSTDGTGQILTELSRRYPNLIHHIPASTELGIGGCWTEAILLPECGKFAIQLDSDDLYKDCHVLQRIVDTFYQEIRPEIIEGLNAIAAEENTLMTVSEETIFADFTFVITKPRKIPKASIASRGSCIPSKTPSPMPVKALFPSASEKNAILLLTAIVPSRANSGAIKTAARKACLIKSY